MIMLKYDRRDGGVVIGPMACSAAVDCHLGADFYEVLTSENLPCPTKRPTSLAMSPVREYIEALRDKLNEALGKTEQTVKPQRPTRNCAQPRKSSRSTARADICST
jgi:hypothetical protein